MPQKIQRVAWESSSYQRETPVVGLAPFLVTTTPKSRTAVSPAPFAASINARLDQIKKPPVFAVQETVTCGYRSNSSRPWGPPACASCYRSLAMLLLLCAKLLRGACRRMLPSVLQRATKKIASTDCEKGNRAVGILQYQRRTLCR
ncbi:hypothetical protein GUJ93_ZPchr0003g18597 [Zizania palustris]|uniref:Uncharacterized protein n=1 Tax=Zizania palustris TaxID=103762 RepID=A0A8J5S6E2_ZIZPA|nr:hypothetical protein GUJ93_ZPchr0003g18597 [Zizania palustris]